MNKIADKSKYKARIMDDQVQRYLATFGAVCIEGPKWCGKTWISSYHANSEFLIADSANNFQNKTLMMNGLFLQVPHKYYKAFSNLRTLQA